jgi:hypothetical protein
MNHEPRSIDSISANSLSYPLAFRGLGHFHYCFVIFYFIAINLIVILNYLVHKQLEL